MTCKLTIQSKIEGTPTLLTFLLNTALHDHIHVSW
jgi:hypothetical protein